MPSPYLLAALAGLILAGVGEYLYRRRTRRPVAYQVGTCTQCGAAVRLGSDFRLLAHNPPGYPIHSTCMGSYLHPLPNTVTDHAGEA